MHWLLLVILEEIKWSASRNVEVSTTKDLIAWNVEVELSWENQTNGAGCLSHLFHVTADRDKQQ